MNSARSRYFIKTVASILIVFFCIMGIQFVDCGKVKAADLDTSKAEKEERVFTHRYLFSNSSNSWLYEYHPPKSLQYRFELSGSSKKLYGLEDDQIINVYDSDKELIATSDTRSLSIYLKKEKIYYIQVTGNASGYFFYFGYDISLSVQTRADSTSEYKECTNFEYSSVQSSGTISSYTTEFGDEVKIGIVLDNLPKKTYTYSWSKIDGHGDLVSLGVKNKDLELLGGYVEGTYSCTIKSKDGSVSLDFPFYLDSRPILTFSDGSDYSYTVKAFRPNEPRTIEKPIIICENATGEIQYSLSDYVTNQYLYDGFVDEIPEDWKGSVFSYWIHNSVITGSKDIYYDLIYFVIGDGDGEKVELDKTVHIDKSVSEGEYTQIIYSFTPEYTGTYRFTTSNRQNGLPVVAVFDSDLNLLAYESNDNKLYGKATHADDLSDLDVTVKLDCKKTYYFAIPLVTGKLICDAKVSLVEKAPNQPQNIDPITDPVVVPSNDEMSFDDFVERLYVVALNRQSEKEGKDYWCELVGNGTLTGADCARFFLTSPEFKGRGLSDEEFLKVLYKTFFDRDAANDPDGFNFWMNSLKSVGKDTVVEGFINSPEWCNICATYGVKSGAPTAKATIASKNATAFATRLYTECLGREPEEGGLKYWSLGLTNLELTGSQAAHEFFYCQEFNDHNFDNKELLTRMYRTFMGREPDTDGLNYWLDCMSKGMTKDQVFNSFVQSQEFTEICASYAIDR